MVSLHRPSQRRRFAHVAHPRLHPDLQRTLAIAGAMTANIMLFLFLLAPMKQVFAPLVSGPDPVTLWLPREPQRPPPPPPVETIDKPQPRPDARTRETPRPAMPQPTATSTPATTATRDLAPAVEAGDIALPLASDVAPPVDAMPPRASAGATLGLRDAPRPDYPPAALRAHAEGTVVLLVRVDAHGRPLEVSVHQSSGNRQLDDAARRQVLRRWSFEPAIADGQPVEASGLVAVEFKLER